MYPQADAFDPRATVAKSCPGQSRTNGARRSEHQYHYPILDGPLCQSSNTISTAIYGFPALFRYD